MTPSEIWACGCSDSTDMSIDTASDLGHEDSSILHQTEPVTPTREQGIKLHVQTWLESVRDQVTVFGGYEAWDVMEIDDEPVRSWLKGESKPLNLDAQENTIVSANGDPYPPPLSSSSSSTYSSSYWSSSSLSCNDFLYQLLLDNLRHDQANHQDRGFDILDDYLNDESSVCDYVWLDESSGMDDRGPAPSWFKDSDPASAVARPFRIDEAGLDRYLADNKDVLTEMMRDVLCDKGDGDEDEDEDEDSSDESDMSSLSLPPPVGFHAATALKYMQEFAEIPLPDLATLLIRKEEGDES